MEWAHLARIGRAIAIIAISTGVVFPVPAPAENLPGEGERVPVELAAMGKRGATIVRAREQVLTILQTDSGCSAWFEDTNPAATETFRSLHYEIVESESLNTLHLHDGYGAELWKNPWAATSYEFGGKNSTIRLNANGAFFKGVSPVVDLGPPRWLQPPIGHRVLRVAWFSGNTQPAQITILLHELGHVIGRIPEDSDSWDGRSAENTTEVLRHCKDEIRAITKAKDRSREAD
jgi:hypothetical protein